LTITLPSTATPPVAFKEKKNKTDMREIYNLTVKDGIFDSLLSVMDEMTRLKISKYI
jgi:hypothetical protein